MPMTVSELQVKVSADTSAAESGLASLGSKVGSAGSALAGLAGGAIIGGIAAIGAGFGAATVAAAGFDESVASMRSKLSTAEWDTYGEALTKTSLRLGKDYPLSASEAAKAVDLLIQKGVSAKNINEGWAESVVQLSTATGSDLVTSAGIAAAASDAFGISADKSGETVNKITGAVLKGGMSIDDYGLAMKSASAVVALAGGTIDDMNLGLATMARRGIEGSDAGTSLRTMYGNLIPTTKGQIAVAKELGLVTASGSSAFFDASGKVKDYTTISKMLATATSGLTKEQQLMKLETLFGADAIRAAGIAADFGRGEIDELATALNSVDAGEVSKKRMDNLKSSFDQFKGSIETGAIVLGSMLTPALKTMVDDATLWVNKGIEVIEKLPAAWEDVKQLFNEGGTDANLENLLMDLGLSEATVTAVDDMTARMGDSWRTMQQAFSGDWSPSDQIDPFVNAIGIAVTKAREFGETVAEAVAKAEAMGAWDNATNGVKKLGDAAKTASERLGDVAVALDRTRDPSAKAATAADVLAAGIKGYALGFEYAMLQIDGFIDRVGASTAVLISFVTGIARTGEALNKLKQGDMPGAIHQIELAGKAFGEGATAAEEFRLRGLDRVAEGTRLMAASVNVEMRATKAAVESNMSAANSAVSEGSAGWQRLMEANGAAMVTAADTAASGVVTAVEAQAPVTVAAVDGMATGMTASLEAAGPLMTAAAETGATGVVTAIDGQSPAATAAAEAMGTGMAAGIEAAAPTMAAAAEGAASGAVAAVQAQEGAASGAGQAVGDSLGSGMQSGILGWVGSIASAAAQLVSSALGAARAEADSHSPSKKTEKLGEDLAEGLEIGLNKSSIGEEMKGKIRDFIQASRDYIPVAGQIADVERRIKDLREDAQTAALFRAKEMIVVDSEALRLKREQVIEEGKLLPLRRDIAGVGREIADIERGTLDARKQAITVGAANAQQNIKINELEKEKIPIRQRELEIERLLIGLDPNGKRAKGLKEEQEELRGKNALIDNTISQIRLQTRAQELDLASYKESRTVESAGARSRKEELDDRLIGQEKNTTAIKDQITVLDAERAVFAANEALIKNATDNEVAYRNRLIAVFTAEGKPLADRITAGKALVEQLHGEGKISDELYNSVKKVTDKMGDAKGATTGFGNAAQAATPQIDAATKKAQEMAAQAEAVARQADAASSKVDALSKSLGKLPSWFTPKGSSGSLFKFDAAMASGISGGSTSAADSGGYADALSARSAGTLMPDSIGRSWSGAVDGGSGSSQTIRVVLQWPDGRAAGEIFVRGREDALKRGRVTA